MKNLDTVKQLIYDCITTIEPVTIASIDNGIDTSKGTLGLDRKSVVSYDKILLSKIIEQYTSLVYSGKPDYEIHLNNSEENKEDIVNSINEYYDNNYNLMEDGIHKAIRDYFIYGATFLIVDYETKELEAIDPDKLYISNVDNNIIAVKQTLDNNETAKVKKLFKLETDNENIDIYYIYYEYEEQGYRFIYIEEEGLVKFVALTGNTKSSCYLECKDLSEYQKIKTYLNIFNKLSINYEDGISLIKLILLCDDGFIEEGRQIVTTDKALISLKNNKDIDINLGKSMEWLPNGPVYETVEMFIQSIQNIKNIINESLGLIDVNGDQAIEETNETTISSFHRVSRETAYWNYKQNIINNLIEKVQAIWLSAKYKQDIRIILGATNLIEKSQKEQQKQAGITGLVTFVEKALSTPVPSLISFYKDAALSATSNSNIPNHLIKSFSNAMDSLEKTAEQNSQQSSGMAQANAQLQAQAQQLEIQEKQTDITKKQADISKIGAEVQKLNAQSQAVPIEVATRAKEIEVKAENAQRSLDEEKRIETERGIYIENGTPVANVTEQVAPEEAQEDTTHEVSQRGGILNRIKQLFTRFRGRS